MVPDQERSGHLPGDARVRSAAAREPDLGPGLPARRDWRAEAELDQTAVLVVAVQRRAQRAAGAIGLSERGAVLDNHLLLAAGVGADHGLGWILIVNVHHAIRIGVKR